MNDLQIFSNDTFGAVRMIEKDRKIYFNATDVAKALGYTGNPQDAVRRHCREDGCVNHAVIDNLGREQQAKFIDEGNLYRLITHSKLPSAEQFERWVFDEVLPSIRKHGAYMTPETIEQALTDPDTIIRIATQLKDEREKRRQLEAEAERNRPKVVFADAVSAAKTSILVGELAKLIKQNGRDIGQRRLFAYLREGGYLMKQGSARNMPTQRSMEMGLFEIKETTIANPDGSVRITKTPKVTGKGQQYFINKFLRGEQK